MARTESTVHNCLFAWDGFDEFAQLGTLRTVIEYLQDEELVEILKSCRKGCRKDKPVKAKLNAFYVNLCNSITRWEHFGCNLAANLKLMRICCFSLGPSASDMGAVEECVCANFEIATTGGVRTECYSTATAS